MSLVLLNLKENIQDIAVLLLGKHGQNWLDSIAFFQDVVQELISFYPHKQSYYRIRYEGYIYKN
jgi:cellobiose-specific phosphotransferase system component IIA